MCQVVYFQKVRFFSEALGSLVSKGIQCQNLSWRFLMWGICCKSRHKNHARNNTVGSRRARRLPWDPLLMLIFFKNHSESIIEQSFSRWHLGSDFLSSRWWPATRDLIVLGSKWELGLVVWHGIYNCLVPCFW